MGRDFDLKTKLEDDGKEDLIIELNGSRHITIHPEAYKQWEMNYSEVQSIDKMIEILEREVFLLKVLKIQTKSK